MRCPECGMEMKFNEAPVCTYIGEPPMDYWWCEHCKIKKYVPKTWEPKNENDDAKFYNYTNNT